MPAGDRRKHMEPGRLVQTSEVSGNRLRNAMRSNDRNITPPEDLTRDNRDRLIAALRAELAATKAREQSEAQKVNALGDQLHEAWAERDAMRKCAEWFAENEPGTPVPEWIDEAMNG